LNQESRLNRQTREKRWRVDIIMPQMGESIAEGTLEVAEEGRRGEAR
jgi:hypothetical protein